MVTTRIAPSPTGDMHIGTARCAYFNWLYARAQNDGGNFILRVDDTDIDRNSASSVDVIHRTMSWLGLGYDEIYYQSKRRDLYVLAVDALVRTGYGVELENGAVALSDKAIGLLPESWHDHVTKRDVAITPTNHEQIAGKTILMRGGDRLGEPTYQLASSYDDIAMGITDIIRGVDHVSNTPKQLAIMLALRESGVIDEEAALPRFHHVGLITRDKKKLSKRDSAASMMSYYNDGYSDEAMLAYMLRLGWGPREDNKENAILPRKRAVEMFLDQGRMKASPAEFDQAKLDWMQAKLINRAA